MPNIYLFKVPKSKITRKDIPQAIKSGYISILIKKSFSAVIQTRQDPEPKSSGIKSLLIRMEQKEQSEMQK
jgi:hypothetical protein